MPGPPPRGYIESPKHGVLFYWFLFKKLNPQNDHQKWYFLARALRDGNHTMEDFTHYILDINTRFRARLFDIIDAAECYIGNLFGAELNALRQRGIASKQGDIWCFEESAEYKVIEAEFAKVTNQEAEVRFAHMIFFIRSLLIDEAHLNAGFPVVQKNLSVSLRFSDHIEFQNFISKLEGVTMTKWEEISNALGQLGGRATADQLLQQLQANGVTDMKLSDINRVHKKITDSGVESDEGRGGERTYWFTKPVKTETAEGHKMSRKARQAAWDLAIEVLSNTDEEVALPELFERCQKLASERNIVDFPTRPASFARVMNTLQSQNNNLQRQPRRVQGYSNPVFYYRLFSHGEEKTIGAVEVAVQGEVAQTDQDAFPEVMRFAWDLAGRRFVAATSLPRIDIVVDEQGYRLAINTERDTIKALYNGKPVKVDVFHPLMILTCATSDEFFSGKTGVDLTGYEALSVDEGLNYIPLPAGVFVFLEAAPIK